MEVTKIPVGSYKASIGLPSTSTLPCLIMSSEGVVQECTVANKEGQSDSLDYNFTRVVSIKYGLYKKLVGSGSG